MNLITKGYRILIITYLWKAGKKREKRGKKKKKEGKKDLT